MPNDQDQPDLGLAQPAGVPTDVDKYVYEYEFEPIQGYPMLNWRGKRPFTPTQYYPAQLKEIHGDEVDGWRNRCSDLQSKTPRPAIIATFRPGLSATETRPNRNYLQLNLQSNALNL